MCISLQRPGAPADGVRGGEAHGAGRVRLRLRGRPHAPHELRLAKRLRDESASRAGVVLLYINYPIILIIILIILIVFIIDNNYSLFAGLHGRRRRHEGLARTHEGPLLRRSGEHNTVLIL